jgi:hypothetical protein
MTLMHRDIPPGGSTTEATVAAIEHHGPVQRWSSALGAAFAASALFVALDLLPVFGDGASLPAALGAGVVFALVMTVVFRFLSGRTGSTGQRG